MAMNRDCEEIALLNSLIQTTMDNVEGYREASEGAEDPLLQAAFVDRAAERLNVVTDLREQVQFLGGTPEESGSVAGNAHRTLLNLKSLLASRDDQAVLDEVQRGESYLMKKFSNALENEEVSLDTADVLEEAHQRVVTGYQKMLDLVARSGREAG
jgi:uncharacterized protein (TIGR02284 family)